MTETFCGVDFGTTNSSVAVANGAGVRVLELDPANDNVTTLPSLLYISREGERIVGRSAADAFIDRNVDREVILKRVDLGVEIEGYIPSEPDKSEGYRPGAEQQEMREAVRAQATVEVNSPGRLFQSLKSSLRFDAFRSTEVFGEHFQIEELTAMILEPIKAAVDRAAGTCVERAVFGRPVRFSRMPAQDQLAEDRLRRAASLAGFKETIFFYEPVAACVEYAVATDRKQRLMVVDIGGGTCDVCVMEFGGTGTEAERLSGSRILSVSGVPTAGDAVDRDLIRAKLYPCFGSNARYGPSQLPMPQYLFRNIAEWQNLYKLNTEEIINWLIAAEASSDQPRALRALRYLIQHNYGYPVRRIVEAAKKQLSFEEEAMIDIRHGVIDILERVNRQEFNVIIEDTLDEMMGSVIDAEEAAQLRPEQVDMVLTTGGTSLIPAVRQMLEERYGAGRIRQRDTFSSVAMGLAIVARHS
ncbi:MAG TPA: Hsp70 family protein [Candidatus Hydrogenedentes bacterium]|nr:Hsp70 family protein [Candidatus Hydrogenedentota bacterium]